MYKVFTRKIWVSIQKGILDFWEDENNWFWKTSEAPINPILNISFEYVDS